METGKMAWNSFGLAMLINVILLGIVIWFFKISLKYSRKKGLLTRRE